MNPTLQSSTSSSSSSSSANVKAVKKDKDINKDLQEWMTKMYATDDMSDEDLKVMYESVRYKGFDREKLLAKLSEKIKDKRVFVQLVLACAVNGPRRASSLKLMNNMTPSEMSISASGQKQTENISCARVTAITADLAAFWMKKLNVPKRIVSSDCPAWLQFPAAGSIKMPSHIRASHIQFSKDFSAKIGGKFNEDIYNQMVENAYLDDKLHLFDQI